MSSCGEVMPYDPKHKPNKRITNRSRIVSVTGKIVLIIALAVHLLTIRTVGTDYNVWNHLFATTKEVAKKNTAISSSICSKPPYLSSEEEPSDVPSIFNCNHPSAGLCEYFYPSLFFSDCGAGHHLQTLVNDTKFRMQNQTLWTNMPYIPQPILSLDPSLKRPVNQSRSYLPFISNFTFIRQDVTMIHVHKAGGSTIHSLITAINRSYKAKLKRTVLYTPFKSRTTAVRTPPATPQRNITTRSLSNATVPSLRYPARSTRYPSPGTFSNASSTALDYAIQFPSSAEFGPNDHILFATLRDPTERFISSIGQVMGAAGSRTNGVWQHFQATCIKNTTQETLRCCINYVKQHTIFVDLHFTPQALEIAFGTAWKKDVPVAVFQFQHLPELISRGFGVEPTYKKRDGSMEKYRPHAVLKNMTVDDYDEDMLRDVCVIYEADVVMHRLLGWDVPRCDPFIPRG